MTFIQELTEKVRELSDLFREQREARAAIEAMPLQVWNWAFTLPDGRVLQMRADRPFPFMDWPGHMLDAQILPRSFFETAA